jgi:hypothetical protein
MIRYRILRCGCLFSLVLSLLLVLPATAQTTITFDDVPPGTDIDAFYQAQGVTFLCSWGVDCMGANVTVMTPGSGSNTVPSSPPNIVTQSYDINFDGCFDDETAIVRATFTNPVDFASIMALNQGDQDHAFLAAYSADGTELDFDGRLNFTGGSVLLTVEAPGIAYVEFSGWQEDSACFDDLTFGSQPVPALPTKVAMGLAILLALGGLYLILQRRTVSS